LAFLRSLVARGLNGVKLVTSDSHQVLKSAIAAILQGASWQRCRTHTIRTQSPDSFSRSWFSRRRAMDERDHVADLQRMFSDDDPLDQQVQQRLFVIESRFRQTRPDPIAERGQVGQHLLSAEPVAA
jgi:hypothetical protein